MTKKHAAIQSKRKWASEKRMNIIHFKVSDSEDKSIKENAKKSNLSVSEYIRQRLHQEQYKMNENGGENE